MNFVQILTDASWNVIADGNWNHMYFVQILTEFQGYRERFVQLIPSLNWLR